MLDQLRSARRNLVAMATATAVTAALLGLGAGQDPADEARRAMQKMKSQIGVFDFEVRMDLGALGQSGVTVNIAGKSRSQAVLSETGVLSVSEADNKQSVNYSGYRSDSKDYYTIALDPNQTAISYMAGRFVRPGVLKLTDPITQVTLETVVGDGGDTESKLRIPPNQALLMEIESTKTPGAAGDVLDSLLNAPVTPARVNRKADNANPAENYARSHQFLQKFSGDFIDDKGKIIRSRMVGEGRYVITHAHGPEEALTFMAWNNAGRFFQQMTVTPGLPMPIYLQGGMKPDGSVELSDPFNPAGLKVLITFDNDGGYSTVTSMGGRELERRTWSVK